MRALPLGPEEGYLLSRIDGSTSEVDLAASSGMSDERVRQILAHLEDLGAIRFEASPAVNRPSSRPSTSSGTQPRVRLEPRDGAAVKDDVWSLLAHAYALHGVRPTLLERDFNFPPLATLLDEVASIRRLQHTASRGVVAHG